MASNSKPLDPKASPYHKLSDSDPPLYIIPQSHPYSCSYPCYHFKILQPFIPISFSPPTYVYNLHLQPSSPPPSPPISEKKRSSIILTPVPSGPRIPKPRTFRRLYRAARLDNSGGARQQLKWRPKTSFVGKKETENDVKKQQQEVGRCFTTFEGGRRRRWKNRSGEYQKVLPLDDKSKSTSVMIKNIPNKYTRRLLIQTLDHHCKAENAKMNNKFVSAYDFLYLPIDFYHRVNAGFAFVNFTNPEAALRFRDVFHGRSWDFFDSPKIAEISRARIQGREALMNNCKIMDFTYGSEQDMPVCFDPARDGSGRVNSKMDTLGKFAKIKSGKF